MSPKRWPASEVGNLKDKEDGVRAVVLRGGRLEVRETEDPVPGPGELLLRRLSTAICASDVHFMDHPELGVNDATGALRA